MTPIRHRSSSPTLVTCRSWTLLAAIPLGSLLLGAAPSPGNQAGQSSRSPAIAAANPYGFTTNTSAAECAGACHEQQLREWTEASGSDLEPVPVWDELDELRWENGQEGQLEWSDTVQTGSLHQLSWDDWQFQYLYHKESGDASATCQRCHIPASALETVEAEGVVAPVTRGLEAPNLADGIACVSCHLDSNGTIFSANTRTESDTGAHAVTASAQFDGATLCESCHDEPMYGLLSPTVTEWRAQMPAGEQTCVDCHMRDPATGNINHAMPGGHSLTLHSAALSVALPATLAAHERATVTLWNIGAAHNAPTGEGMRAYKFSILIKSVVAGQVLVNRRIVITNVINTPTVHEFVQYEQVDPIPLGGSFDLKLRGLPAGQYEVSARLLYYLTKDTLLVDRSTQEVESVLAFGETEIQRWDYILEVTRR